MSIIDIISHTCNTRSNPIFLYMVIYFNLGSTIVAGGLYIEHIAFVPICIVNLIELFGT